MPPEISESPHPLDQQPTQLVTSVGTAQARAEDLAIVRSMNSGTISAPGLP